MDFHFKLVRRSRVWNVTHIRCLNLGYHLVPFNRQNPNFYPDWFVELYQFHINHNVRSGQEKSTMHARLHGQEKIGYFYRNCKLYIDNIELSIHDQRREEARLARSMEETRRKVSRLRFIHGKDSAIEFKNKYYAAFGDTVHGPTAKLYLLNFVKPENQDHFESMLLNSSLSQMFADFVLMYEKDDSYHLTQLKNTPFSPSNVDSFVIRRIRYQKEIHKIAPFKLHREEFIKDLPPEIKSFFDPHNLPNLSLNNEQRIIQHIKFKLDEQRIRNQEQQMEADQNAANPPINPFEDIERRLGRTGLFT